MDKHNNAAITEDELLDLQYENYLETQIGAISHQEDNIERELEHMLTYQKHISQQQIRK